MKTITTIRKFNAFLKTSVCIIAAAATCNVYAEYYIVSPAPGCVDCNVCDTCTRTKVIYKRIYRAPKHHYVHHKYRHYRHYCYAPHKRHSSASISIYYFNNALPPPPCFNQCNSCGCNTCAQRFPCGKVQHEFVTFSGAPTSWEGTYSNEFNDPRNPDMSTRDDDAYTYPNMNIDN